MNEAEMVNANLKLVHKVARKLIHQVRDPAISYDDLYSEGCIGLLQAARKYDPSKGFTFSTFACSQISGYIRNFIDRNKPAKVPANIMWFAVTICKDGLQDRSAKEIMNHYGVTQRKAEAALDYLRLEFSSMDKPIRFNQKSGNALKVSDVVASPETDMTYLFVNDFLARLTDKERQTLELMLSDVRREEIQSCFQQSRGSIYQRMKSIKAKYVLYSREDEAVIQMGKFNLSKEGYLGQRLTGETRGNIAKRYEITISSLENYWLKKWGIKDPQLEELAMEELRGGSRGVAKTNELETPQPIGDSQDVTPVGSPEDDSPRFVPAEVFDQTRREAKELQQRAERAEAELEKWRDEALRNYPIPDAYEAACKALEKHRERADQAESEVERLTQELAAATQAAASAPHNQDPDPAATLPEVPFPVITLTYGLIDFGGDRASQRAKCIEEADEYSTEIEVVNIDINRAASELYDAGQAFVGLIRKQLQELLVDDVDGGVRRYFEKQNRLHLEKMAVRLAGGR